MKYRVLALLFFLAACAAFPLPPFAYPDPPEVQGPDVTDPAVVAPAPSRLPAQFGGNLLDPYSQVFAIMNRPPTQMGCVGCHIQSQPRQGVPWFGKDQPTVLQTLLTGMTPDGQQLSAPPVEGGRYGTLGSFLHTGFMPLNGTRWNDAQLQILDRWLITFE